MLNHNWLTDALPSSQTLRIKAESHLGFPRVRLKCNIHVAAFGSSTLHVSLAVVFIIIVVRTLTLL